MSGPLGSQQWMYATETEPFYPHTIDNSLRFDGSSYLYRDMSGGSSTTTKWTMSFWAKRTILGEREHLFSAGDGTTTTYFSLEFTATDNLRVFNRWASKTATVDKKSTMVFRDPSAWLHVHLEYDSTLATAEDRVKIFVNGDRITSFSTNTNPPISQVTPVNTANRHVIAESYWGGFIGVPANSYLADFHLVGDVALSPTSFGDLKSGIWVPKEYTGTYGTNGFHLDFADGTSATTLGYDAAGSNDFTPSGIATSDQMLDTPTNNCCTLNPLDPGTTGTLSEGNLVTSGNAKVTMRPTTGHWYYEKDGVGNTWDTSTSGEFNPTLTAGTYNFGQRPWADVGPTGNQKAICTQNLPTPTFNPAVGASPQDHFSVDLDADGSGALTAAQAVFSSGIWWLKDRTIGSDHLLVDSARGSTLELNPNSTAIESTYSDPSNSSVSWSWKAATFVSGTTTGSGTLKPYSGYVNAAAGVSVIEYKGNATAGHQIPHHLASAPNVVIVKNRDYILGNWMVFHSHIDASPETCNILLNATSAKTASVATWNSTLPSSSAISLGNGPDENRDTDGHVAYSFAEKAGFSKFGVYQGNFNADGPFVYLGFRPAFVMIKATGGPTGKWAIFDRARDGYNVENDAMHVYPVGAEDTTDQLDLLSNGFKVRVQLGDLNNSAYEYIYMAFAEQPFKYSNAR